MLGKGSLRYIAQFSQKKLAGQEETEKSGEPCGSARAPPHLAGSKPQGFAGMDRSLTS
jgi:hypothetical protein